MKTKPDQARWCSQQWNSRGLVGCMRQVSMGSIAINADPQEPPETEHDRGCITSTPKSAHFLIFRPFLAQKWTGFLYTPNPKTENAPTWRPRNPFFGPPKYVFFLRFCAPPDPTLHHTHPTRLQTITETLSSVIQNKTTRLNKLSYYIQLSINTR